MARRPRKGIEDKLAELEDLVERIEDGSLPLEETMDLFEKGIILTREVQEALEKAEMRVTRLLEEHGGTEAPLEEDGDEPEA